MIAGRRALAAVSIALASGAHAQQRLGGGAQGADVSIYRVFLSLFVCLVLAAIAILFIRHRMGGRLPAVFTRVRPTATRLRFVESRRIAPQADLCLVQCDEHEYLLLITPGGPLLLKQGSAGRGQG